MQLPVPSNDALFASDALVALIKQEINSSDGWITFARFMEIALYAKGLGYYAGGSAKLGKDGDFTTAPELTPLFGATLANFAAELGGAKPLQILEFGAGTGKLAQHILSALAAKGKRVAQYVIVELSAQLRVRQQILLERFPQVCWLDAPPPTFAGLVVANEVLDAMPVSLVVKTQNGWCERGVIHSGAGFGFEDRACKAELVDQIPDAELLPIGYLTEVHPVQSGWMRTLADMLLAAEGGAAVLIDYGFPAAEYYLSQRAQGTLMCHYRHHAHADPFFYPGLQDITAHVDFTQMARVASSSGLSVVHYSSQAAFLLSAGLADLMGRDADDVKGWLPQANAVQKLTSPAEMGELFKVLVVGAGVSLPPRFERHDRRFRL